MREKEIFGIVSSQFLWEKMSHYIHLLYLYYLQGIVYQGPRPIAPWFLPSSNKINQFHPISLYLSRVQNLTDTKAFINDTEGTFEGTSETYEGTVCYLLPSNLQVSIFETYLFIIMLSY